MVSRAAVCLIVKGNLLLLLTLLGVFLGIGIGFVVRASSPSSTALLWLGLPGQLYLRLLKMMIVPLIVSSVTTGTASLDPKANGKISIVAFVFIFATNLLGTILGVIAFFTFRPGVDSGEENMEDAEQTKPIDTQDIFADMLRNIIPDNLFEATFRQTLTGYDYAESLQNSTQLATFTIIKKTVGKSDGSNILGLIFVCTLFGMAASSLKEKGRPLVDFLEAVTQTVIVIIRWFLWTTPIGVLSLILVSVASLAGIGSVFRDLGMFIAAVVVGCMVQQLLVMPLVLFVTTRRHPYKHLMTVPRAWLIAFSAASTAVAIPEMLRACEADLKLDKRITRFVIPFSITLSANGSAIFISCSCLFLSSISGVPTTVGSVLIISFLSTMSALAIPGVPSASIVTIVMILTSLNIPVEAIALLLAVEFLLDRIRTTSSVVSHTMCAAVTHHFCKNNLPEQEVKDEGDLEIDVIMEQEEKLLSDKEQNTAC